MSAMLAQPETRGARTVRRAGFTMVEILFAILIIGILLSLLIVGVRKGIGSVRDTADRQALRTVAVAVSQFKADLGFEPPLVKENGGQYPGVGDGVSIISSGGVNKIEIYDIGVTTDVDYLSNENFTFNSADPLRDRRFSYRTLPIYLAGALEVRYSTAPGASDVPLDGVKGPGFYAPKRSGKFDVPPDVLTVMAGPIKSSLRGKVYEPLVNLGGSAIRILQDPANPRNVALVDRNGVGIRYYKWMPKSSGPPTTPPDLLQDLRVPIIVGRDPAKVAMKTPAERDLTQNPALRNASFALVAAGQNKFFGDEPVNEIRVGMGLSPAMSDDEVRQAAEEDNIVEVGK